VHNITVYKKVNTDKKYLEDIKKANQELNNYLLKCEQEKNETEEKLNKIVVNNKEFKKDVPPPPPPQAVNVKAVKTVEMKGSFDDLDLGFGQSAKAEKYGMKGTRKLGNLNAKPQNPLMSQLFGK
jgi:hypothetical protein